MTGMTVIIIIGGITIIVTVDVIRREILRRRGPCRLITALVVPDVCGGACPAGTVCTVIATRPYFGGFLGATQAAACACAPPGGGGGPGGGVPGGGGGPGEEDEG